MRLLGLLLCATLTSSLYIDNNTADKEKIVGGEVSRITERPHQASYLYNGRHTRGAAIVAPKWVVTGAHGVWHRTRLQIIENGRIRTGSVFRDDGGELFDIKNVTVHPGYNPALQENDIALFELVREIPYNPHQQPIPINRDPYILNIDTLILVSGFGKEYKRAAIFSQVLKEALVKVLPNESCDHIYVRRPMTESVFCTDSVPNDVCDGDNGGPAVYSGKLVGIITPWHNCGNPLYPTVYTNVASHYNWIRGTTGVDL